MGLKFDFSDISLYSRLQSLNHVFFRVLLLLAEGVGAVESVVESGLDQYMNLVVQVIARIVLHPALALLLVVFFFYS